MSSVKQIKDRWIRARVDENFSKEVDRYISEVEDLNTGLLIRKSIREYIINHPTKPVKATSIKPGQ